MIRICDNADIPTMFDIINDSAQAYRGVIPADCWHEPYMLETELTKQIKAGVEFWGYTESGELCGVMGIQHVADVTLIRHAYVRTAYRNRGIGARLLIHLRGLTAKPILIGTWAAASWAIRFYEKQGFSLVTGENKNLLLKKYWAIPDRQIETSVVLAERRNMQNLESDGKAF
jgi:GNAT superfamily N-acetyltransferase